VSPAFLFAALLWHEVLASWRALEAEGWNMIPALMEAMERVIAVQVEKLAVPRRFTTDMKEIWVLQPRLLNRAGRRPYKLLEHPRFRAGYDFLQMRCESGEVEPEVGQWWERFQHAGDEERGRMLLPEKAGGRKRRRRRKPGSGGEPAAPVPAG
jgi:poly(A) polymerase